MRILIVGAGATGGAFGSLLQDAERDVTYLVRPKRAEALQRDGLRFVSPSGDRTRVVKTMTSGDDAEPFDLVIITVKATALEQAIADARSYVGPETTVLPILNGMAQIGRLESEFPGRTIGGLAKIIATLDDGTVRQLTGLATLAIGALHEEPVPSAVIEALDVPGFELQVRADILGALWEKWVFIAAGSVVNCLFRGPIGSIIDAGGLAHIQEAIRELEAVAHAAGHPVSAPAHAQSIDLLTQHGSALTTSLYRDLVAGLPTESEHILGDLSRQASALDVPTRLLDLALVQIRADVSQRAAAVR